MCWELEYYRLVLNYQQEVTVVKNVHELCNYGNSSDHWLITINIQTRSGFCQSSLPTEANNLSIKYRSADSQHGVKMCTRNVNKYDKQK
jgi:hypothetical protein